MRYVLKQKLLSWGDDYYIRDDQGREVYFVNGKVFSLGGQLSFRDLEGNELAFIRQKLMKLSPTYEIHRGGELAADGIDEHDRQDREGAAEKHHLPDRRDVSELAHQGGHGGKEQS